MSNPEQAPTDGESIRASAAEWLIKRRDCETWNADDEAALNAWLDQSPAHSIAFWRLEDVWSKADRLSALRRPMRETPVARARSAMPRFLVAAALVAMVVAGAGTYAVIPHSQAYETPLGGREILTLRDGSQIELNTSTSLRISDRADRREIWLDRGEAYFDVRHDPRRPFVVIAGNHRVIDLGTKFVMRRDPERLEVAVVEGDVRLNRDGADQRGASAVLRAGEIATATASTLSVTTRSNAVLSEELGWRRGVLIFRHTTLAEAVAQFNRYNQHKLSIADAATARLRLGGTFPTANVEGFADAAKEILGLRVTRHEDETIISR